MAKRRTPPLFEVLSGPARRSGPGGIGPRVPIEVRMPGSAGGGGGGAYGATGSSSSGGAEGTRQWNPIGIICVIVAVVLVAFFGLWFVAYQMGQSKQQALQKAQINNYLDTMAPAPATVIPPVPKPLTAAPTGGGVSVPVNPEGQPAIDMGSTPTLGSATDPRRSGNNYLHIVTLSWKDAERAVAYLEKNGVSAAAVPSGAARAVDPSEARAKNLPHLVFALEAIPSDQYRTTERKRQELVEKVRRIGKKWQSEEKSPSDFGEPGWAKFK